MTDEPQVDFTRRMEEIPNVKKVWRAPSKSRPGTYHYVFMHDTDVVECTCEGHRMAGKCWHVTYVRDLEGLDDDFSVSL